MRAIHFMHIELEGRGAGELMILLGRLDQQETIRRCAADSIRPSLER